MGITSAQAAQRGINVVEVNYPLGGNGKSVILQTQGQAKVIAEAPATPGGQPGRVEVLDHLHHRGGVVALQPGVAVGE